MFYLVDGADLVLTNSVFSQILSVRTAGLIWSIQNTEGTIHLENTVIEKVFSAQGLIYLNFASLTMNNTRIIDNYG